MLWLVGSLYGVWYCLRWPKTIVVVFGSIHCVGSVGYHVGVIHVAFLLSLAWFPEQSGCLQLGLVVIGDFLVVFGRRQNPVVFGFLL